MCEPTSNAEVVHVDVAHECGTEKETTNAAATVEYWQSALQELCKNPPPQHAYVANPLAATPQAYGLWSGQIPPPLLTPYGPMPFFGGFFPGAYPIPTPAAAVPTVSLPAVKPEVDEGDEKETQSRERKTPATPRVISSRPQSPPPSLFLPPQSHPPPLLNRPPGQARCGFCRCEGGGVEGDGWMKLDDETSLPVDDRELKKERRKQSNRESARRSRLRKQRECEALQKQVQDMATMNQRLEQEILQLKQRLVEVEHENEQLKDTWTTH